MSISREPFFRMFEVLAAGGEKEAAQKKGRIKVSSRNASPHAR